VCDVFADVLGVDHAAVAQGDALLLGVEGDLAVVGNGPVLERLLVGQPFDDAALEKGFLHQVWHIFGLDLAVEDAVRINHHDGAHGAEPAAAGLDDADFSVQAVAMDLALQGRQDIPGLRGRAARTFTDHYVGSQQGFSHTKASFVKRRLRP